MVELRIPLGAEVHIGNGVGVVIVLTCRVNDKVRLVVIQDRHHHTVEHMEKPFISCIGRQGYVHIIPIC